ncbi:sialidase family protein [Novipirellula artificiosorum]|uniref:exo-alpha-sialidase n=1 Tax=Novipirellula artificiosorum TaxID=2528016 RepID=A0A5C6D0Q3_9BACT|nr:sialidase family protein [Novipirellula artificiosorum]TWU30713.1 Sialidase precursor [Novipirellula artificiosorum]
MNKRRIWEAQDGFTRIRRIRQISGVLMIFAIAFTDYCASAEPSIERVTLFEEGRDGFTLYRIPGIVVTSRGSVLAYCEARKFSTADRGEIEIHLRRSTDCGRTWSPPQQVAHLGERLPRNPHLPPGKQAKDFGGPEEQTVNNPVAITCRNGTVHLLYCVEYMRCFHIRSDDDGLSWSKPVEITTAFEAFRSTIDWQAMATGPGHAIELQSGRLVVPFWMSNYDPGVKQGKGVGVVFSDDQGVTWLPGELSLFDAGEPNIAELPGGGVLLTARNGDARSRRISTTSSNGATNWSTPRFIDELYEPGCMAGMVSHPGVDNLKGPLLLFSNVQTTERAHSSRRNLTIHLSRDGGAIWPVSRVLEPGPSAYSDLAVLPDGQVLCCFEDGSGEPVQKRKRDWAYTRITVARFNLQWLLQSGSAP